MTLVGTPTTLGVSLIEDQLRMVEGRKAENEFLVSNLAQGRVRQPFNFEVFTTSTAARRFAEDINRLYETQNLQVKDTIFSLDSRMVLIKKFPVDRAVAGDRLEEHINWEVKQFMLAPVDSFVVDYEEVNPGTQEPIVHVLVVVVRKRIIEFVKEMFRHTDLNLKAIDVDIFSAQRTMQVNYDYSDTQKVGLIDVEEKKLHFLILEGKNYFVSQDLEVPTNHRDPQIDEDSKARFVSRELRRIVVDHQLGRSVEDLDEIFLFGEALENDLVEDLQNTHDVRIDRANPFKKVRLLDQVKETAGQVKGEKFVVSVGAALKAFQ